MISLVSWNVNGIRAVHRNGFWGKFLKQSKMPDIIALQETKASEEQLPDDLINVAGYHSYFASSKLKP